MKIEHHPDDATLMSFAAGSLCDSLAAVVASHATVCPRCQQRIRDLDVIGSVLLGELGQGERVGTVAADRMAQACEQTGSEPETGEAGAALGDVPAPLNRLVGERLDTIPWKRLGFGIWHYPLSAERGDLRLIKVAPGQVLPEHGHGGAELTLVLSGSYPDEVGTFRRGDVADLDEEVEHRPIASPEDGCICLIASEERVKFKGLLARITQPFTGI